MITSDEKSSIQWTVKTDQECFKDLVIPEGNEVFLKETFFLDHKGDLKITVEKNAKLFYLRHQWGTEDTKHESKIEICVEEQAQAHIFYALNGGALCDIKTTCYLKAQGAQIIQNGVYFTSGENCVNLENIFHHDAPETKSSQKLNGLVADFGVGKFKGKIIIPHGSKESQAFQVHRNMILSNTAKVISEPELEILEHDVCCSHGSAIGQLSEEEIFYFQSRGIPQKQAKKMLSQGFLNERLELIPCKKTKQSIQSWLMTLMEIAL